LGAKSRNFRLKSKLRWFSCRYRCWWSRRLREVLPVSHQPVSQQLVSQQLVSQQLVSQQLVSQQLGLQPQEQHLRVVRQRVLQVRQRV
jgi:hypothetical protein